MRRLALAMLTGFLATGIVACTDASDQGIVNDEDPLTSSNGLSSNGLSSNGLSSNGLSSNGLSSNGLSSNGLLSNALVMTPLRDQTATGDLTRLFFRYLISCALPTGHSVSYTWTDAAGALHTEVNPGGLGLAPDWETGAASQADKEIVSACLGARTNAKAIPVPISIRADGIAALAVSSAERSAYTYGEGAFWGNLFNGGNPYLYACTRTAFSGGATTSQYLAQGRTCTTGGCGVITSVGPCYQSDLAITGQACFERGGTSGTTSDWVSDCNANKNKFSTSTSHVLTTWLMP
jgi:hypothetical protein